LLGRIRITFRGGCFGGCLLDADRAARRTFLRGRVDDHGSDGLSCLLGPLLGRIRITVRGVGFDTERLTSHALPQRQLLFDCHHCIVLPAPRGLVGGTEVS